MIKNISFVNLHKLNSIALSLRTKMLIFSGIVFLGFGIIVLLGSLLLRDVRIGGTAYTTIRSYQKALEKIANLKSDFNQIRVEYLSLVEESSPEIRNQRLEVISRFNTKVDRSFAEILACIPEKHHKPLIDAKDEWKVFTDNMSGKIIPVILEGNRELALERLQSIQKHRYDRLVANLETLISVLNQLSIQAEQSVEAMVRERTLAMVSTSLLIFLIVLALALIVSLLLVQPLRKAAEFARKISDGDLTGSLQVSARDEVGALAGNLNEMVRGLGALVSKIGDASHEISRVSQTVSLSSEQVSAETEHQVNDISQVSTAIGKITVSTRDILDDITKLSHSNLNTHSSVAEMAASIAEVARYTETLKQLASGVTISVNSISASIQTLDQSIDGLSVKARETTASVMLMDESVTEIRHKAAVTAELAEQANKEALVGQDAVHAAMTSMEEIRRSSHLTREAIEELSSSVGDIGAILSVIDEVTSRTALLALNARIISAQAGESGRAFAVVADEFKLLSQRTASSTSEITEKIERMQKQTKRAVSAIRTTETVVLEGERLSRVSGDALGKIVSVVKQTSNQMEAIAQASAQQSSGSRVIGEAVHAVSATMEQIATASHNLKQESIQIATATERLNLMTAQVMNAVEENSLAAKYIATASETISTMIERIMNSCEGETVESGRILHAVEDIRSTMNNNLHAAQLAHHASGELLGQVEKLLLAIHVFKQHPVSRTEPLPIRTMITHTVKLHGFHTPQTCDQG
jgi:methyl-accepting chemotaxis protein